MKRRIATSQLNKAFDEITKKTRLAYGHRGEVKMNYISQVMVSPPTFLCFSNNPELVPEHYKRYIENSLRERFDFGGAPIRLVFKRK